MDPTLFEQIPTSIPAPDPLIGGLLLAATIGVPRVGILICGIPSDKMHPTRLGRLLDPNLGNDYDDERWRQFNLATFAVLNEPVWTLDTCPSDDYARDHAGTVGLVLVAAGSQDDYPRQRMQGVAESLGAPVIHCSPNGYHLLEPVGPEARRWGRLTLVFLGEGQPEERLASPLRPYLRRSVELLRSLLISAWRTPEISLLGAEAQLRLNR